MQHNLWMSGRLAVAWAVVLMAVSGARGDTAPGESPPSNEKVSGEAKERPSRAPWFYAADYGEILPASGEGVTLWWSDATRKIPRDRTAPTRRGAGMTLSAARHEFEGVQLVVRPAAELRGLTASVSDLTGSKGARIKADEVKVLRVGYVPVTVPTDARGAADDWPDPLPPFDKPIDLAGGVNQPIWILVHVPADASPGDYEGTVTLQAKGWSASVPLRVHVWDFTLPDEPFTQSAFGLDVGTICQYHGVTDAAQQRALFAKYMKCFSDHRISPYNPTPFDPIGIKFVPDADPPRAELDWSNFDVAMERAVKNWHISSFQLHIPGTGGGTFHARREGEIAGHAVGTPEYEAMFASVVKQMEEHLRAKGWLDKAYIYWFDEPDPKDYEFVRVVMDRIHRSAPGLRRMLTEQPEEPLFGAVDLWCAITDQYDHERAEPRRAHGEQFWWYVCTGPKVPYCTLFIDHPATNMRVWLWQTWQRRVAGILVWTSTYWTSGTAFPDSLQNPYKDPMAYRTGYGQPKGTIAYWGNGDGRFLYPPERAAAGSATPILDGPVSCIRLEALRDGIDDVDYMHLLDAAIKANRAGASAQVLNEARSLLEVPPAITSSMTEYTFDPTPIYEHRRKVAEMIERLGGSSGGN